VVISVLERDPRCKMITIDPDTAQPNPQILRTVNQTHDNKAGVMTNLEGMHSYFWLTSSRLKEPVQDGVPYTTRALRQDG
jgi:hypothetical protein